MALPTLRYCHEMYGGLFKQKYGWYIQKTYYDLGISPGGANYLKEICPPELQAIANEHSALVKDWQIEYKKHTWTSDKTIPIKGTEEKAFPREKWIKIRALQKKAAKLERSLSNSIENITRMEFGFRKVGERWVSETLLYQIICRIYPKRDIIFHHRPDWLNGLELDIFIPSLNMGIEYQGQQHYRPMKFWGGRKAFKALQSRDQSKIKLCKNAGITLLKISYLDALTDANISRLLNISLRENS